MMDIDDMCGFGLDRGGGGKIDALKYDAGVRWSGTERHRDRLAGMNPCPFTGDYGLKRSLMTHYDLLTRSILSKTILTLPHTNRAVFY
jgi:hypothetical protein